jgi:hypothetical protein
MCTVNNGSKPNKLPKGAKAGKKGKPSNKKDQGMQAQPVSAGYKDPAIGLGDAFIQGLSHAYEDLKENKGSTSGFLGREKQTIDIKEYSHDIENPEKTQTLKKQPCPDAPIWKGKGPNSHKEGTGADFDFTKDIEKTKE